jgi:parvulin-like peptidyl-prolyl isomerase
MMRIRTAGLIAFALLVAVTAGIAVTAQDNATTNKTAESSDSAKGDETAKDDEKEQPVRTLKQNQVARVNDRIITAEEFIQRLCLREKLYTDPDLRSAKWALDSLIIDELLVQESDRIGAIPKRRWQNDEFDALMKDFSEKLQMYNKAIVAAGAKPYSKEEWVENKYSMSWAEFEAYLHSVAKDNIVRRQVVNYWKLTTDCADAEGVFVRKKKQADTVYKRLKAGERIEKVARSESADMHTRQKGGKIGTVYRGDGSLDEEVSEVFWKLNKGVWSEPIEVPHGFWIVRKAAYYPRNEAQFFKLQDRCLKMPNPDDKLMLKWRHAVASGGLYTYERRMPGWDCQAGEN